jgi:hypothetical protein
LAYRRTGLKKIILAAIAFSLFAIQLMLESLEDTIGILEEPPIGDILSAFYDSCHFGPIFLSYSQKEHLKNQYY